MFNDQFQSSCTTELGPFCLNRSRMYSMVLWRGGLAVLGSCGVGELRCRGIVVWGNCGEEELWCGGVAV